MANQIEHAAIRKLAYQLAQLNGNEVDVDDTTVIEAVNIAVDNLDTLGDRIDVLEERTAELDSRTPDLAQREYETLSRDDKVRYVRERLTEWAQHSGGKAAADYQDVRKMFDGKPTAGHAYDLMEAAAETDGFTYRKGRNGKNARLERTVDQPRKATA